MTARNVYIFQRFYIFIMGQRAERFFKINNYNEYVGSFVNRFCI